MMRYRIYIILFLFTWFSSYASPSIFKNIERENAVGNIGVNEQAISNSEVKAVVDIAIQISENAYDKYIDNKEVSLWKIRWWPDVAISAGAGFVSSGAGSLAKFAKYATSPRGQKALKIAIEASTDFIINSIADIAKNHINGEDPNYLQTVLINFVGSSAFATLNNTGLFNKLKEKISPAKKVEITPVVTPSITQKANTLRNNITTNTAKSITTANVTKTQVENRILTTANIAAKGDLPSVPIQKKLNEIVGQETKKIETDVAEVVEGKVSKEVEEEIKKEFYINNKQVTEDEFKQIVGTATGIKKFTLQQIDEYVELATKNKDANKVMLGEFIEGNSDSYVARAKNEGYTYFDMENKWGDAKRIVDDGISDSWKEEMWKINKQFIDNQKSAGKEFYFSQEPWTFPSDPLTFRFREAEYLIDLGAKDLKKINNNTWKVIW